MRRWLYTAALLGSVALPALAAPVDPQAVVRELQGIRNQRLNAVRDSGKPLTLAEFRAIEDAVRNEAKARLKDVDAATIEPAQAYGYAQLYQLAGENATVVTLLDRYLATKPDAAQQLNAQTVLLLALANLGDGARIAKILREIRPSSSTTAATLASTTAGTYIDLVAKSQGLDAAQAILDLSLSRLKDSAAAGEVTGRPETHQALLDSARSAVYRRKAEFYVDAGKKDLALQTLNAGIQALGAGNRFASGLEAQRNQMESIGKEAPAIKVTKTLNGDFKGLTAYRGKVVVLDFFAHWCGPCIASLPDMRKMYDELKPQGLEVLGVTRYYGYLGQERNLTPEVEYEKMQAWVPEKQINWPVLFSDQDAFRDYGITGIPHVTVIDRQGKVRKIKVGYSKESFIPFRAEIERMLRE